MGKTIKDLTYRDWWESSSSKLFAKEELLGLSEAVWMRHQHLSYDHVFYLTKQVLRCIYFQFSSHLHASEATQLELVEVFSRITRGRLERDVASIPYYYVRLFYKLNCGDITALQWGLSDAVGVFRGNPLPIPDKLEDYAVAAAELVPLAVFAFFRPFYNLLVTLPQRRPAQQEMLVILENLLANPSPAVVKSETCPLPDPEGDYNKKRVTFAVDRVSPAPLPDKQNDKENLSPGPVN